MWLFRYYSMFFQRGCRCLPDKRISVELGRCMEKIVKWFDSETFIYLDCVICDDYVDPNYSANIAYKNLELDIEFQELYYGVKYKDVADYLIKNRYSVEEIKLLNKLRFEEEQKYHANKPECFSPKDKDDKLSCCIEKIAEWFRNDTFRFIDLVLADDRDDPEYSANSAYHNLELVVEFQKLYYGVEYKDADDCLIKNGYSVEQIKLLEQLRIEEKEDFYCGPLNP